MAWVNDAGWQFEPPQSRVRLRQKAAGALIALASRLAAAAQVHVHANFTLDQMARRVEAVYEELAAGKGIGNRD